MVYVPSNLSHVNAIISYFYKLKVRKYYFVIQNTVSQNLNIIYVGKGKTLHVD